MLQTLFKNFYTSTLFFTNLQECVRNIQIAYKHYKKIKIDLYKEPYLILERLNHREYKDAFLLQDINIQMHKMMVLMCSATLNRLEITTTD